MGSELFSHVPVESVREFWDKRPCNIRHSAKPIGTREYFEEVEKRKYLVEPHIPRFAEFERWNGKKVLEIGCGIGTDTMNFARHGAQVTVVELSENSLEIARKRASIFNLQDRIKFYQGNAEELTRFLPVEKYALVYSFGVIHHSPHPERIFQEIRSYVADDTILKIMMYHRYSWKVLLILLKYGKGRFWKLDELIANYSEAQFGSPVTYVYTPAGIRNLLEKHGFHTTSIEITHIFPYRIPDYIEYRYVMEWYFGIMPSWVFHWLERNFGWHLCVTARSC
jgi:SAM-dependent methyltransferase